MCVFVCLRVCVCGCTHEYIVVDKVYVCITFPTPPFSHAHLHTKFTHFHELYMSLDSV